MSENTTLAMRPICRKLSLVCNLVTYLNGEAQREDESPCHLREVRPGAHTPEKHELVWGFREDCRVSEKRRRSIDLLAYTTSTTIAASTASMLALFPGFRERATHFWQEIQPWQEEEDGKDDDCAGNDCSHLRARSGQAIQSRSWASV